MAEETVVRLAQAERYRFNVSFEGPRVAPVVVDEPPPTGGGAGPNPAQSLAVAVGHCMSSTLYACFERSRVSVKPISTVVRPVFGRNDRGRLRVVRLEVAIDAEPVNETDRPQVEHCLSIFEDLCPVSGAVRDGAKIELIASKTARPSAT